MGSITDDELIDGMVSVIMPAYNCRKYISEAIQSVENQTYENWELIIVDDNSTDGTGEIVEKYKKKDIRIKYYRSEINEGPAASRNKAIDTAKGEYIAFLDSDDIWMSEKLEIQIDFMKSNHHAICCSAYKKMDEYGKSLHKVYIPYSKIDYWRCFLLSNPVGNSTVVYNRKILGNQVIPDIKKRNDFALWLQLLRQEKYIYGIKEPLVLYRVRQNSVSSSKVSLLKYHWRLYHFIENHNYLVSITGVLMWMLVKSTEIGLIVEKCD